ncbi:hypothetical protein KY495_07980 [Massilia sp. PAMC28688]|nr:hypothetical protein KY495_07980 [Massilia sp. PAMC28688]
MPLTFGQVFAQGDLGASQQLLGKLPDGRTVPLQVDVKARHADGSVRHAVMSAMLPKLAAAQTQRIILAKGTAPGAGSAPTAAALLAAGFSAGVQIDLAGVRYSASADSLLRSGKVTPWLNGPVTAEWLVSSPLVKSDGTPHPHLAARFAIRTYSGVKQARVDVSIENNWAFEPAPRNFKYDAQILVGGRTVYKKADLTHYHHARWRKVLWWGDEPSLHVVHNVPYLLATRALPNYDRSVRVSHARLDEIKSHFTARSEPMAVGNASPYMPATGGRDDIGLLPGWAATYLLTMDERAKDATLGTADLAGSWSIHYRDKATGRPVSLHDYPYMTVAGQKNDTLNPVTKNYENFPACAAAGACTNPNAHDMSHQPSFAYLPYIVTGDHYYLEELQFWGMFDAFFSNPGYRQGISGLVKPDQVRGQAWGLRSIANAAYITPDNDPLKKPLDSIVKANLKWYNDHYTNNAQANKLGVLSHGYAIVYANNTGLAPWMDDFFTSAVGHVAELGYRDALPLLKWKAKFPIGRMTAPEACWVTAAMYSMKVRDKAEGEVYNTLGKAWKASTPPNLLSAPCGSRLMASVLGLSVGEMTGYSKSPAGYPANMQPALAYAADVGGSAGAEAWQRFMARSVKPNYGNGPAFAIIPR